MSKVKIQGNASGTGVVTLTAPNTNTDRTITLPDDTQTLIGTNASGNVGIVGNLNIGSYTANNNADNLVIQEAGDFTGITLAADNDQGSNIYFADPQDDNVGGITYDHASNYMNFRVNGAEKLRIQSGGGISFNGDTAAANALDDYEEGTWTPTFLNTTVSAGPAVTTGHYTKIGNIVHFQYYGSNMTLSGGNMVIGGLPFLVQATNSYSTFHYEHGTASASTTTGGYPAANNTILQFIGLNTAGGVQWATGSGKYLMVSGTYQVN